MHRLEPLQMLTFRIELFRRRASMISYTHVRFFPTLDRGICRIGQAECDRTQVVVVLDRQHELLSTLQHLFDGTSPRRWRRRPAHAAALVAANAAGADEFE